MIEACFKRVLKFFGCLRVIAFALRVDRLTEENDVVVAEGVVEATRNDSTAITLAMCDVFEMRGGLIRKLVSYLMEVRG